MTERRNLKVDLAALGLLALCALASVALATYDPEDPPGSLVDPPRAEVANSCGRIGAWVAHALLAGVGYAAAYVVASIGAVSILLLKRRELNQPVLRGVGWGATLAAITTLAAIVLPNVSPGPEAGAGGYLGAMGHALLDANFATAGGFILALSVLVAGLLLSTDYLLIRFAAKTTAASGAGLATLAMAGQRLVTKVGGSSAVAANVTPSAEDDEEDSEEGSEGDEAEYEYEYEEEEGGEASGEESSWEEDEQEEPAAAEPLRVKTPASKAAEADEQTLAGAVQAALAEGATPAEAVAAALEASESAPADAEAPVKNRRTREGKRTERDEIIDQLQAAESRGAEDVEYELPPLDLLLPADDVSYEEHEKEVRRKARVLEKTFKNFGFNVKVVEIETGPVIAQFEVELEAGLRLSKITGLADDLAIALRVPSVRIVAPIPGKNTVGIEVPNENRQLVRLREVIEEANGKAKRLKIPIYLGKDVAGNPLVVDLTAMPHLLIAGRTGTGKSVCLNSIIVSMLMTRGPDEVRMLMIDPKMVELSGYKKLPHLMHPVVTDMRKAEAILAWAVDKMEERYALLARAGVRHVTVYNQLSEEELRERIEPTSEVEWESIPRSLPFIVIVADEMADLMMTSGKEVEQHIIRLAQKSRAVGIHLILATQKPTVDVITGLIKSNLPARIAFQVASRTDSRVVLDEMGADKLLGNGDMLFLSPGTSQLLRGQGTYLSDDEITRVTDFVATDSPQFARELIELKTKDEEQIAAPGPGLKNRDELYEAAVDVVVRERRGSVSLLQRCLGIGYGRAARLIDYMAEDGIVGDYNGSQAREVVISIEDWEAMSSGGAPAAGGLASGESVMAPAAAGAATRGQSTNGATSTLPTALTAATVEPKQRRPNRFLPGTDEPSDVDIPPRSVSSTANASRIAPWETEIAGQSRTIDEYDVEDSELDSAERDAEDAEETASPLADAEFDDVADAFDDEQSQDEAAGGDESDEDEEDAEDDSEEDDAEYEYEYEYEDDESDEAGEEDESLWEEEDEDREVPDNDLPPRRSPRAESA
jgi:S-DNA-T family DNA segregation ATPase FtsK/SpoIIIE